MKYVIYLRVSTKKQNVNTQLEMSLEYLRKNVNNKDFEYIIYMDEITSRKPLHKREGMRKALHAIKRGDVLVGQRVDRLARSSYETHFIKQFLDAKGADLMMTEQPGIKNKVVFGTYIGIAEEEVNLIRERTKNNLHVKKMRGERIGTVPYGYVLDMDNLIWVNGEDGMKVLKPGKLLPDKEEQKALNRMCDLFDEGLSFRQIAHTMQQEGYSNRKGAPFQHMSIFRILSQTGRTRLSHRPHEERELKLLRLLSQEFLGVGGKV